MPRLSRVLKMTQTIWFEVVGEPHFPLYRRQKGSIEKLISPLMRNLIRVRWNVLSL
jgi:hypothetical protein